MLAQEIAGIAQIGRLGKPVGAPQIEDDRGVLKESRAALDLHGKFPGELGIAQHTRAHDHHREESALTESARCHPQSGPAIKCPTQTG
jgi:hypothetical protein